MSWLQHQFITLSICVIILCIIGGCTHSKYIMYNAIPGFVIGFSIGITIQALWKALRKKDNKKEN